MPKLILGEGKKPKPHLILHGVDKAPIRAEIFQHNRQINNGINRCWMCGKRVHEIVHDNLAELFAGEWDHIRNISGERCDCPENGRVACHNCHTERHPQPRLGKRDG